MYHSFFFLGIYQLPVDSLGINGKRKEKVFENAVNTNLISIMTQYCMSELNVQISGFFCILDYLPLLKSICKYFVGFFIFLV